MRKLFGTDGVRGVANVEPMTSEIALKLGRAAAYVFQQEVHRHRIVIGKDTRLSGYMLESALISGICSMGVDVLLVGPLPTPGIAFITKSLRADAGVVISASHNSYEDNGIKFFSKNGLKLPDDIERQIENLVLSDEIDHIRPVKKDVGKAFRINDAEGRYIEFLKNSFPRKLNLEGLKIVVDCANGAAYKVAPAVLRELGAEVVVYNDRPDGRNINFNCGSLYPEIIQKAIIEHQADIGITHDGDADRVILADEKGEVINGDHIMAICALDLMKKERLNKKTLVTTVMSNIGLDITIKNAGGTIIRTDVGDRYVVEEMIKGDYNLGGEQSGHMIFMDFHTTGDGIITALQVLSIMKGEDKKLSELASVMVALPQVLVNVKVKEKKNISEISEIDNKIKMVSDKLNDTGRVLVRYSGTEPLVRVMLEGRDEKMIKTMADEIAEVIRKHLG